MSANSQYPNQDLDKLFDDLMDFISKQHTNHPGVVAGVLIATGTSFMVDMAPTQLQAMDCILESVQEGVKKSNKATAEEEGE